MVDEAIRKIIPLNPIDKNYGLHDPLSDMFRFKKGRIRIVWAADSRSREVLIVFISDTPRKEGDAKDPYVILQALAQQGYLKKVVNDWRRALEVPPDAAIH